MKVMKVTLLVIDFDGLGENGVRDVLETTQYPNHCIGPDVQSIEVRDIGEWSDDNPLNYRSTASEEFKRLFA